eukprot:364466-Chlamydomonas_euryale.AAC.18
MCVRVNTASQKASARTPGQDFKVGVTSNGTPSTLAPSTPKPSSYAYEPARQEAGQQDAQERLQIAQNNTGRHVPRARKQHKGSK